MGRGNFAENSFYNGRQGTLSAEDSDNAESIGGSRQVVRPAAKPFVRLRVRDGVYESGAKSKQGSFRKEFGEAAPEPE
ncbi:MAG: hypothetical protein ICV82_03165 [Nitrososphaera sp.]|nr:hypothetical protein [Nitrososphaera sp.]